VLVTYASAFSPVKQLPVTFWGTGKRTELTVLPLKFPPQIAGFTKLSFLAFGFAPNVPSFDSASCCRLNQKSALD